MRTGDLRHRIIILRENKVSDSAGGRTVTWVRVATVWAAIWPLKAQERINAERIELEVTHRIRIRFRAGIAASMRISYESRIFTIFSIINPDERNIMLELLCKEIA